jgi:hypothetical protein
MKPTNSDNKHLMSVTPLNFLILLSDLHTRASSVGGVHSPGLRDLADYTSCNKKVASFSETSAPFTILFDVCPSAP